MRVLSALLLFALCARAASAGEVQLQIRDGRVWMSARDATVGQILDVWARVGGTTIVNGDEVAGPRLTLELSAVPEAQALDVILRSASGYMAVNRAVASTGSSTFDRILILANSVAPREAPRPAPAMGGPGPAFLMPTPQLPPGQEVQRLIGPDGLPVPDDQEGAPPPFVPPTPFGFSSGDAPPEQTAPPPATPQPAPGTARPGMIVPPPPPVPNQPPFFRPQP